MLNEEIPTMGLSGSYRDVMRDAAGRVTWDSGWRKNTIVVDCRRLLAGFMRGQADTLGIQGLQVGAGKPEWDTTGTGLPPAPDPMALTLEDGNPYTVKVELPPITLPPPIAFDYIAPTTGLVSASVTNRLQIVATLGPGVPTWSDAGTNSIHRSVTLREFGLVGQLDGKTVLINAVRHVAIPKDSTSTLVRTIQLVF